LWDVGPIKLDPGAWDPAPAVQSGGSGKWPSDRSHASPSEEALRETADGVGCDGNGDGDADGVGCDAMGMPMRWGYQCDGDANAMGIPMRWGCQCDGDTNAMGMPMGWGYQCDEDANAMRMPMRWGCRWDGGADGATAMMAVLWLYCGFTMALIGLCYGWGLHACLQLGLRSFSRDPKLWSDPRSPRRHCSSEKGRTP
jgi:hypothetical protein